MTFSTIIALQKKIHQIGPWAGVRMMRNRGIPFEDAYRVMFDREPRR